MEGEDTGKSVSVHIYATRVEELRGSEVNVEPAAAHRHSPQPARQTPHRLSTSAGLSPPADRSVAAKGEAGFLLTP